MGYCYLRRLWSKQFPYLGIQMRIKHINAILYDTTRWYNVIIYWILEKIINHFVLTSLSIYWHIFYSWIKIRQASYTLIFIKNFYLFHFLYLSPVIPNFNKLCDYEFSTFNICFFFFYVKVAYQEISFFSAWKKNLKTNMMIWVDFQRTMIFLKHKNFNFNLTVSLTFASSLLAFVNSFTEFTFIFFSYPKH